MRVKINNAFITLKKGDITDLSTDAIVNAANTALKLGGGVAGAIKRKGGPEIQKECDRIGGCPVGGAVITTGGNLKAKYVIHAVGPRYGEGNEDEKLRNATNNSLRIAEEKNLESIAFPAISTGIFGFPMERCAEIMLSATVSHLRGGTGLKEVIFCLYDDKGLQIFRDNLKKIAEDQGLEIVE
ncbi:MAG: macro domain-containing protein [Candidatus Syntropharchaeia archaeon]